MNNIHYPKIDLNLLLVFDAVMTERHITRAAVLLGLTQPAVSHALGRLRAHYGDPLFVRTAGGMEPTPLAASMAAGVRAVVEDAGMLLGRSHPFNPATSTRRFVVGMSDYAAAVLLPRLAARIGQVAPGVSLVVKNASHTTGHALLDRGEADLIAGNFPPPKSAMRETLLYEESFVCAWRAGNTGVGKRLTLKRYLAGSHLQVSTQAKTDGVVDSALARQGERRRVTTTISHFLAAPLIIATTDLIATEPARLFAAAGGADLTIAMPPFAIPVFSVVAVWPARVETDEGHAWLRRQVEKAATGPCPRRRRPRPER